MKKLYIILVIITTLIAIIYLIIKRALANLIFFISNIQFSSFSLKSIAGQLTLTIQGNFLGNITISGIDLSVYIDNYFVGKLNQVSETEITNSGDILALIKFSLSPQKVVSMDHFITSLSNYGNNSYTIKGSIKVKKWFITAKLPIDFTSTFKKTDE